MAQRRPRLACSHLGTKGWFLFDKTPPPYEDIVVPGKCPSYERGSPSCPPLSYPGGFRPTRNTHAFGPEMSAVGWVDIPSSPSHETMKTPPNAAPPW